MGSDRGIAMSVDRETAIQESELLEWIESVHIVDKDGKQVRPVVKVDDSDDPENDRAED
jgi:hypothetical protein